MSSDSNLFDGSFRLGYGGVYTGDISIDADAVLVASQLSSLGVFNGLDLKVKRRELTSPSLELLSIEYQVEVMNENDWHLADQALRIRRYPTTTAYLFIPHHFPHLLSTIIAMPTTYLSFLSMILLYQSINRSTNSTQLNKQLIKQTN